MRADVFSPLLTYPDPTSDDAVRQTLEFIEPFASGITFCVMEVDIPNLPYRGVAAEIVNVPGMIAAAENRSRQTGHTLRELATSIASKVEVSTSTVQLTEDQFPQAAARAARTHDLAVIVLDPENAGQRRVAEGLAFGAGGPLLLLPAKARQARNLDHVAIAWDGSCSATRAVRDAMPFIVQARQVSIVTAFDDKDIGAQTVLGLNQYLARHGVEARHDDVSAAGISVGLALQDGAIVTGAGLLVMGAFGHSRLREFILGGATRATFDDLRLPVLLSH